MDCTGNLLKMRSELLPGAEGPNIKYLLPVGSSEIDLTEKIGSNIKIAYRGRINCIHCGRETKKSFAQGYCYPCFISLPQTDTCVLHPEKCRAHLGISRDMSWSERNCLTDHFVYLALTPALKVGVTRSSQIPTRWIDQGASEAIIIARTPNRYLAGEIEVFLKSHLSDKTNWRRMLSGEAAGKVDLVRKKELTLDMLPDKLIAYKEDDNNIVHLRYPVKKYPAKVKSLNLDKDSTVIGLLSGIKGQYLIFESGEVLNIRKHGGYFVTVNY
jgi:hypothetical protein